MRHGRAARSGGTGHRSLRGTFGGYDTPFCWDDQQLRMDGPQLILQQGAEVAGIVPVDLDEAAMFVRVPLGDPGDGRRRRGPGHDDRLELDPRPAADMADWIGFGVLVFERFRAHAELRSRVTLEPDRFAVELETPAGRLRLPLYRPGIELDGEVIVAGPVLTERDDHVSLVEQLLAARMGHQR